jgi:hypothetical protein
MLQDRHFFSLSLVLLGLIVWKEICFNYNIAVQKNLAEALSVSHKTKEASNVETCGLKERVENPTSSEGVHNSLGKHYV